MSNDERFFGLSHSFVIGHSCFVIPELVCSGEIDDDSCTGFRSRNNPRFRPSVSLGKGGQRICWGDRRGADLCGAARRKLARESWRKGISRQLLRAGSSARGNLRVVSARSNHGHRAQFLSRLAHHSSTEVGMSGDIHLFVDETSCAHQADLARPAQTLW